MLYSQNTARVVSSEYDEGMRAYMLGVYNYMAVALCITGLMGMLTLSSPALFHLVHGTPLSYVLMLAPIGFVLMFSMKIHSMSVSTAQICLWSFSAIMGMSLSYLGAVYTGASIAKVFFMTSALFGSLSLYGYTTKKSLSGMGTFLFMGLISIIIASIINIFLQSSAFDFAISLVGMLVFSGLTAYDTQRIKDSYHMVSGTDQCTASKVSIMGALTLYMDFINLFIILLRFFGDRRD